MKFSRVATALALPLLAVATPWGTTTSSTATTTVTVTATATETNSPVQQCSTGSLSCCNSLESASSSGLAAILGLLGIVLDDITALIGLTCTPINIVGVTGTNCASQTVCCENIESVSLIGINCSPINIGL